MISCKWMRLIIGILLCILSISSYAQNLIINGSFEQYDTCPEQKDKRRFPVTNWYRLNDFNTTDYFNEGASGCFNENSFLYGEYDNTPYTKAYLGSAYIGMYQCPLNFKSITTIGYSESPLGKLSTTLQKDSIYRVSMHIKIPVTSTYNLSSFSMVFLADSFVPVNPYHTLSFHEIWNYLEKGNRAGIAELDIRAATFRRNEWIKFETTYRATGKEKFILLSFYPHFSEKQKRKYQQLIADKKEKKMYKKIAKRYTMRKEKEDAPEGEFFDAYFYIDDVRVEKLSK